MPASTAKSRSSREAEIRRRLPEKSRSDEVDLEDPACRWTIVVGPAGMDAGITTDQLAVVHGKPVRVAGVRSEVHRLQYVAGRGFVPHQTGPILAIPLAVIADDLP